MTTADEDRTSSVFLVGRDRELLELRAAARQAAAGRGGLALVTGEPGIGKTTLVRALAEVAEADGMRPLWGACWEGESAPAFWPWVQLVRACIARSTPAELAAVPNEEIDEVARFVPGVRREAQPEHAAGRRAESKRPR